MKVPIFKLFEQFIKKFLFQGEYRPYNVNQPLLPPKRAGAPHVFAADSPLTEMGTIMAQMIGRGLDAERVLALISSPALRCVQTAKKLASGMAVVSDFDSPIPICIEPGLFDFVGKYAMLPCFMTAKELAQEDFTINLAYQPLDRHPTVQWRENETVKAYRSRIKETVEELLQRYQGELNFLKSFL